jgi:hypothetical protein
LGGTGFSFVHQPNETLAFVAHLVSTRGGVGHFYFAEGFYRFQIELTLQM